MTEAEAQAIGRTRRLYINKADIVKYGLTEGCLGCRCLAEGPKKVRDVRIVLCGDGRGQKQSGKVDVCTSARLTSRNMD